MSINLSVRYYWKSTAPKYSIIQTHKKKLETGTLAI